MTAAPERPATHGPQVPFGPGQADVVVAAMNTAGTGGSTPMGRAMKAAREYLDEHATENTTVVLAADGKPSDTCLQDCTPWSPSV